MFKIAAPTTAPNGETIIENGYSSFNEFLPYNLINGNLAILQPSGAPSPTPGELWAGIEESISIPLPPG